ncbi:MAG: hypothetical protein U7123_06005 [Potamolinea sp.]
MYKCTQSLRNPYFIAFILIFACWFLLLFTSGALFDGYHFEDDHEIAAIHHQLTFHKISILQTISQWIQDDYSIGRFRPLYYIHRIVIIRLLGFNLFWLSFYNFLLASFSTFVLFVFAKKLNFSFVNSILFSLVTTLGLQSETWWWLGPAEAIGTFLLAFSLIFLVFSIKAINLKLIWEVLFYIFVFLMSGSKESFILKIPALVVLRIWLFSQKNLLSWYQALKKNLFSSILLLFLCGGELLYIKYYVGTSCRPFSK